MHVRPVTMGTPAAAGSRILCRRAARWSRPQTRRPPSDTGPRVHPACPQKHAGKLKSSAVECPESGEGKECRALRAFVATAGKRSGWRGAKISRSLGTRRAAREHSAPSRLRPRNGASDYLVHRARRCWRQSRLSRRQTWEWRPGWRNRRRHISGCRRWQTFGRDA